MTCACCNCLNCVPLRHAGVRNCAACVPAATTKYEIDVGGWAEYPELTPVTDLARVGSTCLWETGTIVLSRDGDTSNYKWRLTQDGEDSTFELVHVSSTAGVDILGLLEGASVKWQATSRWSCLCDSKMLIVDPHLVPTPTTGLLSEICVRPIAEGAACSSLLGSENTVPLEFPYSPAMAITWPSVLTPTTLRAFSGTLSCITAPYVIPPVTLEETYFYVGFPGIQTNQRASDVLPPGAVLDPDYHGPPSSQGSITGPGGCTWSDIAVFEISTNDLDEATTYLQGAEWFDDGGGVFTTQIAFVLTVRQPNLSVRKLCANMELHYVDIPTNPLVYRDASSTWVPPFLSPTYQQKVFYTNLNDVNYSYHSSGIIPDNEWMIEMTSSGGESDCGNRNAFAGTFMGITDSFIIDMTALA